MKFHRHSTAKPKCKSVITANCLNTTSTKTAYPIIRLIRQAMNTSNLVVPAWIRVTAGQQSSVALKAKPRT